jgi:indolepyruvate ferredoxin oxidoreductase, beta subunit
LEIKSVLIAAIGGQGGNILSEWLFTAANLAGHLAQSVGLPGLAQRGGATSQYIEIAIAENGSPPAEPIFCLAPVQGQVDVLLAQELLEMGRMIQRGYPAPDAAIITSTQRNYTVWEKMPMGGATADPVALEEVGRQFAKQFVPVDVSRLIQERRLDPLSGNAMLLGALAASGALPIRREHYVQAIQQLGLAVDMNLTAFEIGFEYVRGGGHDVAKRALATEEEPIEQRAAQLPERLQDGYRALARPLVEQYGETLGRTLIEATYQLTDYQDLRYARHYLERVGALYRKERAIAPERIERTVTQTFASNLATLMSFEDAVRVADFKTRPGRFERIKERLNVAPDQVYEVVDYLKPDAEEIYGIFPWWLVTPLLPVLDRLRITQDAQGKPRYWTQMPRTTTLPGYMTFKLLTWFKPLRPHSWRNRHERKFQQEYERAVYEFLAIDYELAVLVAGTGQFVRGYGRVRRRTFEAARYLIDGVLRPLVALERGAGGGYRLTRQVGEVARQAMLTDEEGIELVRQLMERVLEKYGTMPVDVLIEQVARAGETLRQPLAVSVREVAVFN